MRPLHVRCPACCSSELCRCTGSRDAQRADWRLLQGGRQVAAPQAGHGPCSGGSPQRWVVAPIFEKSQAAAAPASRHPCAQPHLNTPSSQQQDGGRSGVGGQGKRQRSGIGRAPQGPPGVRLNHDLAPPGALQLAHPAVVPGCAASCHQAAAPVPPPPQLKHHCRPAVAGRVRRSRSLAPVLTCRRLASAAGLHRPLLCHL